MPNDGNFKELIVDDGWHEFEPHVLFDNPQLITVGTWKVWDIYCWCCGVLQFGTKEFKRNAVENAPVDIWFVVPNLNPVDCNCSQLVPLTQLVHGCNHCEKRNIYNIKQIF